MSAAMIIFIVRDGPPTRPSSNSNSNDKEFSVVKEFKLLIRNKNYIYLCIAYSFIHSNTTALGSMMSSLTRDYGYSGSDNGLFGAAYIISGIIGSVIGGILLDQY
jgi:MFS-type transporter involved in bile tolerance (Atg22 family)